MTSPSSRIALMWRGEGPPPDPATTRFHALFTALAAQGLAPEPVLYAEAATARLRAQLQAFAGLMVWVDPISEAGGRTALDGLLRELSAAGLWVSGHPDTIARMGVKSVLYHARDQGWGADTWLYETPAALAENLPRRLATGPRVLKRNRGNGGIDVWRVETAGAGHVDVLPAREDHVRHGVVLGDFLAELEPLFADGGAVIDQAHQPRVGEGMVRCYVSQNEVVGFSEQFPRARQLAADDPAVATFGMASAKTMHEVGAPKFQGLRRAMETDWIPGLQARLGIETEGLPALWDADFLYGPGTAAGEDSFVLCEINASSVAPFPQTAAPAIARHVANALKILA